LLEKVEIDLLAGEEKNIFQMDDLGEEMDEMEEIFTCKLHQI